ncbi:MAG: hypothetical protein HY343_00500 [Lentisphaerae bacterium]|nr:hypothetical protein [Lentisphaerota bacterium]
MDEKTLTEKLRLVQSLFEGGATPGERQAAAAAMERIQERLKRTQSEEPPTEMKFTMPDLWSRRLFAAMLRRYGIRPYRYSGQRHTTMMARVSLRLVDETLWPEFEEMNRTLRECLNEITDKVIKDVVFADDSEPEVRGELSGGGR